MMTATATNLGKQWSAALTGLINLAMDQARLSPLGLKHGAVLFTSKNRVCQTAHNDRGSRVCGYDVPSLHAEAQCLHSIYLRRHRESGARCCQQRPLSGQYVGHPN